MTIKYLTCRSSIDIYMRATIPQDRLVDEERNAAIRAIAERLITDGVVLIRHHEEDHRHIVDYTLGIETDIAVVDKYQQTLDAERKAGYREGVKALLSQAQNWGSAYMHESVSKATLRDLAHQLQVKP